MYMKRLENTPANTHARANSFLEGFEASVKRLPRDKGNVGKTSLNGTTGPFNDLHGQYKWYYA